MSNADAVSGESARNAGDVRTTEGTPTLVVRTEAKPGRDAIDRPSLAWEVTHESRKQVRQGPGCDCETKVHAPDWGIEVASI